jgi:hypothetical protein
MFLDPIKNAVYSVGSQVGNFCSNHKKAILISTIAVAATGALAYVAYTTPRLQSKGTTCQFFDKVEKHLGFVGKYLNDSFCTKINPTFMQKILLSIPYLNKYYLPK